MDKVTIVGKRRYSLVEDSTGQLRNGVTFYYTAMDGIASNVGEGVMTGKFSLSDDKLRACNNVPMCGDCCEVYYNRYGKVDSVAVCEA